MKRGIIAGIILISIVSTAIAINFWLGHKTDLLFSLAQTVSQDKSQIEKLNEEWDKQVIYFKLFTDHASFEALEKKIKKLPYVSEENYGTICAEIIFDIVLLKEHISFSPSNIF